MSNRILKNIFLFIICLGAFLHSCSIANGIDVQSSGDDNSFRNEDLVYDTNSGMVLIKREDPFALDNLNLAKQRLIDGSGTQILTKAETEIISFTEITPTHYALTIFPKNEEELFKLEGDSEVSIAYYPFNYSIIGNSIDGFHQLLEPYNHEINPYTIRHENVPTSHEGFIPCIISSLPVLYVVWPIGKPIPDSLNYRVDYEVSLPSASNLKQNKALRLIQNEAYRHSIGMDVSTNNIQAPDDSAGYKGLAGYIWTYDNYTDSYEGVGGLTVTAQYGSYFQYASTTTDGYFYLLAEIPDYSSFYISYSKIWYWTLRSGNTNNTIQYSFGFVQNVLGDGVQYNFDLNLYPNVIGQANHVQRAISFYYKELSHDVTPVQLSPPINIHVYSTTNGNILGSTSYTNPPTIKIYNNSSTCLTIATLFHEMGHAALFYLKNCPNNWNSVFHPLLNESFAGLVGWHLCDTLYYYLGSPLPDNIFDPTGDKRQGWTSALSPDDGWYSPLFVDLVDNYNQYEFSTNLVNDTISGVPYSAIWQIILSCTDWASCRSALYNLIDTHYSTTDFNNFVSYYDTWFSTFD